VDGLKILPPSISGKQLRGVAVLCFLSFPFSPLILTRNYAKSEIQTLVKPFVKSIAGP